MDMEKHFKVLQRQKKLLSQAKSRQGQKPTAAMVRSRQQLEHEFSSLAFQSMMRKMRLADNCMMCTAFIGEAYPPSLEALTALTPMTIRELRLETHHRGRVLVGRTFCQPARITSVINAFEDDSGDVSRVAIYNLPWDADPDKVLPNGAFIAVKEPYFKATADGSVIVRVDHPADIFLLSPGDALIPTKLRKKGRALLTNDPSAAQLKLLGNEAFQGGDWPRALEHYTSALGVDGIDDDLRRTLLRNRAGALLRLSRHEMALEDSLASVIPGADGRSDKARELNVKALYRAATAAYGLADFAQAKDHFEQALALDPTHKETLAAVGRTRTRLDEQQEGKFDFIAMSRSATKTHRVLDHASFTKNTVVKPAGGKLGRGLFATKDLEFGDVVLAEKAFCAAFNEDGGPAQWLLININTNRVKTGTHALCLWKLIERMTFNPRQAAGYLDLHDGGGFGSKEPRRLDSRVVLDTFQVQNIAELNGFACADVKSGPTEDLGDGADKDGLSLPGSMGTWLRASYSNHSCLPNAYRSFIGDMMIVRASQSIKAGEQIFMAYTSPFDSYADRQKRLKDGYGFKCECPLCGADSQVSDRVAKERKRLASEADAIIKAAPMTRASLKTLAPHDVLAKIQTLKKLNDRIRKTYDDGLYSGLPRLACEPSGSWLCQAAVSFGALDVSPFLALLRDQGYKCAVDGDRLEIGGPGGLLTCSAICAVVYAADANRLLGRVNMATVLERVARTAFIVHYGTDEAFDSFFDRTPGVCG